MKGILEMPVKESKGPIRVDLPKWQAATSIVAGFVLVCGSLVFKLVVGSEDAFRVVLCVGLGLILAGLGLQVSGKIKSWNVAGGGASAIVILALYYQLAPPTTQPPVDPAIQATVEGEFPLETTSLGIEVLGGQKLLGAWQRVNENYLFRMEKAHLKHGCIMFETSVLADNGTKSFATYVSANFFRGFFAANDADSDDAVTQSEIRLWYKYHKDEGENKTKSYIYAGNNKTVPISQDRCFGAGYVVPEQAEGARPMLARIVNGIAGLFARTSLAAELKELSNKELIENLRSSSSSVRREAETLLANKGAESVEAVMEMLRGEPNNHRFQKGVVGVLSKMMNSGVNAVAVRDKMTDADVAVIAGMIGNKDRFLGSEAALTTAYLRDPRANAALAAIITGKHSDYAKLKAAGVLNQNFDYFDDKQKAWLKKELAPSFEPLDANIRELIRGIVNYRPGAGTAQIGWIYLGTNFGAGWGEQYFASKTKNSIPKPGDVLTATGNVNLRTDHIKFDIATGWKNAPSIGVVKTGQTVKVKQIKLVAGGFYWAEIERQ